MAGAVCSVVRGIVLRSADYKEADKMLTVLTDELGKISVAAKGARSRRSKFAACSQVLAYSELSVVKKGDYYYLKEGSTLETFQSLTTDLTAYALGCYFAELVESVAAPELPSVELLRHLLNALYALGVLKKPEKLVKAAFELRLLCLAGFEPLADGCAVCGSQAPTDPVLDIQNGVVCCCTCGQGGRQMPLAGDAYPALQYVLYGDEKRLYSFRISPQGLHLLGRAAETFLTVQLERNFRTLDFYHGLCPAEEARG